MEALSPEEARELEERPVGTVTPFSPEQLALRIAIAHKISAHTILDAQQHAPELAPLYAQFPCFKFYTDLDGEACRRVHGFCLYGDGDYGAHTVRAMHMFNNSTLGGVPLDELRALDEWSPKQLEFLRSGLVRHAGLFLDPLGFLMC